MSKDSLRRLIIKLYVKSGFNNCRIQPLAMMKSADPLKSITQARAFLGLVEQVSFTFSKCADVSHFRHLLSPKTQFIWTEDLDREFGLAKASIVRKIHKV